MTAGSSIDPAEFLHEHLAQASLDLLRELMEGFINTLRSPQPSPVLQVRRQQSAQSPQDGPDGLGRRLTAIDVSAGQIPNGRIGLDDSRRLPLHWPATLARSVGSAGVGR